MLKAKDLRNQSVEELKAYDREISRELYELRNELSVDRKISKPHLLREKKRDRARVLTVLQGKV